jgi:8-oxo-dGTP pyrophosphatase MutT (NUDIX family)
MKEILYNHDNLNKEDIDETVIRVKMLMINSKNEVLLGYSYKTYQFPGGHLEEGEALLDCVKREVLEETGIELNIDKFEPFFVTRYYNKNYHDSGKNRNSEIYFYVIHTDELFNLNRVKYDEGEIKGNFELRYINLNDVEKILIDSIPDNEINKIIVGEMLEVFKEYKEQ